MNGNLAIFILIPFVCFLIYLLISTPLIYFFAKAKSKPFKKLFLSSIKWLLVVASLTSYSIIKKEIKVLNAKEVNPSIELAEEMSKFKLDPQGYYVIFEGEILPGDFGRLIKFLKKNGKTIYGIQLFSPGGSVVEAMKIGNLIRELKYNSVAPLISLDGYKSCEGLENPENCLCASSCFFIYLGGVSRSGSEIYIHRPFLDPQIIKNLNGNKVLEYGAQVNAEVKDFLGKFGVDPEFVKYLYSIPPEKLVKLDQKILDIHFNGKTPELQDWINSQCRKVSKAEDARWMMLSKKNNRSIEEEEEYDRLMQVISRDMSCPQEVHQKLVSESWEKIIDRELNKLDEN